MPSPPGTARPREGRRCEELEEADSTNASGPCRLGAVVGENREGDRLGSDEVTGVVWVPGPDRDHLRTALLNLLILAAQLRGMLAAEQSANVPHENEDDPSLCPEIAQPQRAPVRVLQSDLFEPGQIHRLSIPESRRGLAGF